jgi:hypothetical protein
LKISFPYIVPYPRPQFTNTQILDPNWISGFVSAEGCFRIDSYQSKNKVGYAIVLNFYITQHIRDNLLMESIKIYLNCGLINSYTHKNICYYVVKKF